MSLQIIIGPMFSNKTTTLINYYNDLINTYNTIVINHKSDNRYDNADVITSHNQKKVDAIKLVELSNLNKDIYKDVEYILIDESQFFGDLCKFVLKSLDDNKHVILAGLNGDFKCKPFMNIMILIPYADNVKFMTSYCSHCIKKTPGFLNHRLNENKEKEFIGTNKDYVVLCRKHYKLLND